MCTCVYMCACVCTYLARSVTVLWLGEACFYFFSRAIPLLFYISFLVIVVLFNQKNGLLMFLWAIWVCKWGLMKGDWTFYYLEDGRGSFHFRKGNLSLDNVLQPIRIQKNQKSETACEWLSSLWSPTHVLYEQFILTALGRYVIGSWKCLFENRSQCFLGIDPVGNHCC